VRTLRTGRSTARLLADFGHDLPTRPDPEPALKERSLFTPGHGRGGPRRPGRGWSPATAPVSQWRMTSDQAAALWPLIATPALPPTGAQIGIDELSGGSFYADPLGWVLDDRVPVTNPNIFCFGKPGGGKSTDSKVFIAEMIDFGYKAFIHGDPKDEYEALCRAYGVEPFAVGPGMSARINPLDLGPLGDGWDHLDRTEAQRRAGIIFRRWITLIRGLVGSQFIGDRRVPFGPTDARVIAAALAQLTGYRDGHHTLQVTTLPQLWQALNEPTSGLVAECRYDSERQFLDETRLLRDALAQLCTGVLAGMFDDHTTIAVDWNAPIQSLSLSRLEPLGDEAVGIALTCLSSWGRAMRELKDVGDLRINVRDEMWKQMRLGVEAVKSLDADLRLSRRDGEIQYMIGHKPGDMLSVGEADSAATAIAKELLHLADIKILHGQDPKIGDELEELLDLGPIARGLVTDWATQRKGRAVWCVGDQLYKVQTVVPPAAQAFTYTNQAIDSAA
jgi:hypothetical protein